MTLQCCAFIEMCECNFLNKKSFRVGKAECFVSSPKGLGF